MPDENRVFDVSKPGRPSPTSKPVIVGHHPTTSDPMVRADRPAGQETHIPVAGETARHGEPVPAFSGPMTVSDPVAQGSPAVFSEPISGIKPLPHEEENLSPAGPASHSDSGPKASSPPASILPPEHISPPQEHDPHIEALHFQRPKARRRGWKSVVAVLVVLFIAFYLLVDSGLVNAGFSFPFHVFKQKAKNTATSTPPPANNQTSSSTLSLPVGFKEYKLADTDVEFAAPTAWGDPTSTTDPGYSLRGGTNQSDGVYAYLVNFSTNKDIQIAVTSAKFLPTTRTPLYYDYLKWCVGTNDNKIYESVLNFTTANKVDAPTTVTCNQGPVVGAVQLDSTTIVQAKAQNNTGAVIGDIYTKNLNDPSLVVFRVKDAAMTNGAQIKQMLGTVQLVSTSSSSGGSSSNSSGSSNQSISQ